MTSRSYTGDWTLCETHGKRAFTSRKAAKHAMRVDHPDDSGMREYPCDAIDGAWHFGHLHSLIKERGLNPYQPEPADDRAPEAARRMADVFNRRPRTAS